MELTNKIKDICVEENKLTIPQYYTDQHDGSNKPRFEGQLFVLLDCSGSTRAQLGFDRQGNKIGGSHTKIIISAECEGIMWSLMSFIKNYDMTGTILTLITFGTDHTAYPYKITSNYQLYNEVICKIEDIPINNGGGTNLYNPLKVALSNLSADNINYIILATDGQPNDKTPVLEILKEKIDSTYHLFVIGAGSIQESIGTASFMRVMDHSTRILDKKSQPSTITVKRETNRSECDKQYLESLVNLSTAKCSLYTGAYGDYQDLKESAEIFISECQKLQQSKKGYRVMLDGGKYVEYSNDITCAIDQNQAVLTKIGQTHYMITQTYQIAIDPSPTLPDYMISTQLPKFCLCENDSHVDFNGTFDPDYEILANLKFQKQIYIRFEMLGLIPSLTPSGFLRIRTVKKF
jgi:hypothetical protein